MWSPQWNWNGCCTWLDKQEVVRYIKSRKSTEHCYQALADFV
jgi:hypothetical protein